jgi:hypothetical protein
MAAGPFKARRDGSIDVVLGEMEAEALAQIARDVLEGLGAPEAPDLRRLFPPAYEDDEKKQEEFAVMTRLDLTERKRGNARFVMEVLTRATRKKDRVTLRLDAEGAQAWLGTLNDARLILGERLGVTEAREPPDDPPHRLYAWLSGLEWALVDALMGA